MAPVVGSGERKDKLKIKGKSKHMDNIPAKGKVDQKPFASDVDSENKQWFEDRSPGDGSPINSFPAITRKSLADDLDTSANKSWYEIVEDDENAEKMPLEENLNAVVAKVDVGVKIKQEKLDKPDNSNDKDAKSVPLLSKIKVEKDCKTDVKQESYAIKLMTPKTENDVPQVAKKEKLSETVNDVPLLAEEKKLTETKNDVSLAAKEEKPESVGLKREREVQSSLSSESDSDLKETQVKQQKQERRSQRTSAKKARETEPATCKEKTPRKVPTPRKESSVVQQEPSAEDLKLARLTSMRKRNRDESKEGTRNKRERNHSTSTDNSSESRKHKIEKDPLTLARRQKQIDFGKNTVGYDRYLAQIPKEKRTNLHPRTPPKHQSYSRRAWDGMVKIWRQQLHIWDPPDVAGEFDSMSEISTTNSSSQFSDDYTSTADSHDDGPGDCLDLGQ